MPELPEAETIRRQLDALLPGRSLTAVETRWPKSLTGRGTPVGAVLARPVTNVWHQEVALAEPIVRFILGQLDGTRTVTELTRLVRDHEQTQLSDAETSAVVEGALQLLARAAVLVG